MEANEFQRDRILSCCGETEESLRVKNELEKGGEGSRGGRVIGHNKSGRPIYAEPGFGYNGGRTFNEIKDHEGSTFNHKAFARMTAQSDINDKVGTTMVGGNIKHEYKAEKLASLVPNHGDEKKVMIHEIRSHDRNVETGEKGGWKTHVHQATVRNDSGKVNVTIDKLDHEGGIRKSDDEKLEKGGKAAFIGEKRTFGGREYIKTAEGWKFHGKGTGAKAKEHTARTSQSISAEKEVISNKKEEDKKNKGSQLQKEIVDFLQNKKISGKRIVVGAVSRHGSADIRCDVTGNGIDDLLGDVNKNGIVTLEQGHLTQVKKFRNTHEDISDELMSKFSFNKVRIFNSYLEDEFACATIKLIPKGFSIPGEPSSGLIAEDKQEGAFLRYNSSSKEINFYQGKEKRRSLDCSTYDNWSEVERALRENYAWDINGRDRVEKPEVM